MGGYDHNINILSKINHVQYGLFGCALCDLLIYLMICFEYERSLYELQNQKVNS